MQRWLKQQSGLSPDDLLDLQEQRSGKQSESPRLPTASSRKINRFLSQGLDTRKGGLSYSSQLVLGAHGYLAALRAKFNLKLLSQHEVPGRDCIKPNLQALQ